MIMEIPVFIVTFFERFFVRSITTTFTQEFYNDLRLSGELSAPIRALLFI
jgi:hypothetical protein